jgi:hypothetical protein
MSARAQSRARAASSVASRRDAQLKIDPEFADKLRHVLYDRSACCPSCKYNLSGVLGERCPECGVRISEFLRIADTTPWRIPARLRALMLRKFLGWIVAPLVGTGIVVLAAILYLTWP